MTVIKVSYGQEIRRFNLPEENDQLFALLAKALSDSFKISLEDFRVTYIDDEGDKCIVSGNDELREAIRFFKASPVKLSVEQLLKSFKAPKAPAVRESVVPAEPAEPVAAEPVVVQDALESKEDSEVVLAVAEPAAPTPTIVPSAAFVRDVTLPDGSVQACGTAVLKIWEITNNGESVWPDNCKMVLCKEKEMENKTRIRFNKDTGVVLPALAPGASCQVGVELKLPNKQREGSHQIFFELVTADNERFAGDYLLFADLLVQAPLPVLTKQQFLRSVPLFLTPPDCDGAVDEEVRAALATHLEQNPGIAVHTNIRCDGCDQAPIKGARFQCTVCRDFDLCESCEAKGTHPVDHPLIKLNRPRNSPFHHHRHPHHHHHGFFGRHHNHHQRGDGPFHSFMRVVEAAQSSSAAASSTEQPESASASQKKEHHRCGKRGSRKWSRKAEKEAGLKAEFVQDLNLADGSEVVSGTFTKKWAVKNSGSAAWAPETTLVCLDKTPLVTFSLMTVPLAEPGQTVEVSVEVTPLASGRVQSYFRLYNPSAAPGLKRFGPKIWLDVTSLPSAPVTIAPSFSLPLLSSSAAVVEPVATPAPAPTPAAPAAYGLNLFSLFSRPANPIPTSATPIPTSATLVTPLIEVSSATPIVDVQPPSEAAAAAASTPVVVDEVAPSPAPTPFLVLPVDEMYPVELRTLFALGFTDLAQCRHLLLAANGDVQKVVNWLLR